MKEGKKWLIFTAAPKTGFLSSFLLFHVIKELKKLFFHYQVFIIIFVIPFSLWYTFHEKKNKMEENELKSVIGCMHERKNFMKTLGVLAPSNWQNLIFFSYENFISLYVGRMTRLRAWWSIFKTREPVKKAKKNEHEKEKKNEMKWKRSKSSITRIFLMILKFLFSLMFSLSLLRFVYGCFSLQFTSLFCLRFSFLLSNSMLDRFLFILYKDWKFNDAFFSSFLSELLFSISSSKWCFRWVGEEMKVVVEKVHSETSCKPCQCE